MLRVSVLVLSVALVVGLQTTAWATAIGYTAAYANATDTPSMGTMIDPSDYCCVWKAGGNALDKSRVYMWDWRDQFQMLKWDMGFARNFVRVYPDCENGFFTSGGSPTDGHDYLEWSLWGSNSPAEDPNAWALLWDPIAASSIQHTNDDLTVTEANGSATTATIWRYGTDLDVGLTPGDAYNDAFTIDFSLPESYRYFGIRASTMAWNASDPDPEINAVATVPEPSTLLALGTGLVGLGGVFFRRRRR